MGDDLNFIMTAGTKVASSGSKLLSFDNGKEENKINDTSTETHKGLSNGNHIPSTPTVASSTTLPSSLPP